MAAKTKPEVSKSEEVRTLLQANPQISAKEVVATLGKKGISVTDSLYYIVKGKMRLKKHRIAKAAAASANGSAAKPVKKTASPEAPNKSEAIRGLLSENPKIAVEEAISTLAAKGIEVKKGLFYLVKGKMRSKKRRLAKEKVATEMVTAATKEKVTPSSNGSTGDALKTIMQVKGLANELGGLKKLKALVDALSE